MHVSISRTSKPLKQFHVDLMKNDEHAVLIAIYRQPISDRIYQINTILLLVFASSSYSSLLVVVNIWGQII